MWRNLFPFPSRLLVGGTIMIRRIPIVCLASRRGLVLLPSVCLIVVTVWLDMFVSIHPLWPHPLRVFSTILLRVHSLVLPITTVIRLPTFLRGVTTSTIVTTVILTMRPTLTLSMPPTTRMMKLFLALIMYVMSRCSTSILTLSILILPLRPLILLLCPSVVSLV